MAKAVLVFKENMFIAERLQQEQEKQKGKLEEEKKIAMNGIADNFEQTVKKIVSIVASASTELTQTAQGLASVIGETNHSVKAITTQIEDSKVVVQESVGKTEVADGQANTLSQAVMRVKNVIGLIANIAGQINLLALNATIESARAGEAGKGFAVVANEVKTLATQTNRSIEEIQAVFQEMNAASAEIIDSLRNIKTSVLNISGETEVASQSTQTTSGMKAIGDILGTISQSSVLAASSSEQVLSSSQELSKQAEALNQEVENFLSSIRAA